jgi:small subunit ribosomal protein S16
MAVKLRLQRHGKKGKPFFHIVAADARSPRDGKYIERLGSYNPNTNPATIILDNDKAMGWLENGAQPSDTMRAILSYTGVLFKQHLAKGVAKGAMSQDDADKRYEAWKADKDSKIQAKKDGLVKTKTDALGAALKHERTVNENRLKAMTAAAEQASADAAAAAAPAPAAPVAEAPAAEAPVAEAPAAEETPATDAPAENTEA